MPLLHTRPFRAHLSLDLWAVVFSLLLALAVRLGLLTRVPW